MRNLGRNLVLAVVLGVVVYAVLAVWKDVGRLGDELAAFSWWAFAAALGLAFANYLVRFVRWEIYCRQLDIRLPLGESFGVFLAGFVMSVTPAKLGEVLKSVLLKERRGVPVATSAPIVLAERLTDLIAVVGLAAVGALSSDRIWFLAASAGLLAAIVLVVGVRPISERTARLLSRLPLLRRRAASVDELFRSARVLCRIGNLALPTLIAAAGWFCECIAMYAVAGAFPGVALGFADCVFVYSFSTVVGALLMLPGGLVGTEGTMSEMLAQRLPHARQAVASATTILVRLATLWFAVLVGLVALAVLRTRARPPR